MSYRESFLKQNKDKFYPQTLDPTQHLFRERLIRAFLGQANERQLFVIEGQAGQGKSILAAQFISRLKSPAGWYQLGSEDGDPVSFIINLMDCLRSAFPTVSVPLLVDMAAKGEIIAHDYKRYLNILCAELAKRLGKDSFLVFDDLHFLEGAPHGQTMLGYFATHAPARLHFILTSRRPIWQGDGYESLRRRALILTNETIGFSIEELSSLYNDIWQIPITLTEAKELRQATEGWVMGLILPLLAVASTGEKERLICHRHIVREADADSLACYFREEVLSRLAKKTCRLLCQLSLLETVPLSLAEQVSEDGQTAAILRQMTAKNYFVRPLNEAATEFAFHHLFREAVRMIANEALSPADRAKVFETAGRYYFERKLSEPAIAYYVKAECYDEVDKVLEEEGLRLCALNRLTSMSSVLLNIPDRYSNSHGWVAFFQGIVLMEKNPPTAIDFLKRSLKIFSDQNNAIGSLHAMAKIVYFHLHVDGKFNLGLPYLEALEKSFGRTRDKLADSDVMHVAHILSSALTFIRGDLSTARKYSEIALAYATELQTDNTMAEIYLSRAWGCFADLRTYRKEVETCYPFITNPSVSEFNKMMIRLALINLLEMDGEFDNYFYQESQFLTSIHGNLIAKTFAGPFLTVWRIDIAVARGEYEKAYELVRQGMNEVHTGSHPHIRSQFFHYLALLHAIAGEKAKAQAAAEEALALRGEVGGRIFIALGLTIVGSAYALLGMRGRAEELLYVAIGHSLDIGEEYLRAGAYAALACLKMGLDAERSAEADVRSCLHCLKKHRYRHFFGFSPAIMKPVLAWAIDHHIEPEYAQELMRERLGSTELPDGACIPLMKIQALGCLTISVAGKSIPYDILTPTMRELLALVTSAPGMKLYQEEILANLWPDIAAKKARGRFDTLLMELRRTLKSAFDGIDLEPYIVLKRGCLTLQNSQLDAEQFITIARKGLTHYRQKELWQASNCFYSACQLWKGPYLAGMPGNDFINAKRNELDRLYGNIALRWAGLLMETDQFVECFEVLDRALAFDPTNDALVKALYRAYVLNRQPVMANRLLKRYEVALREAEYAPADIAEALADVWNISVPAS